MDMVGRLRGHARDERAREGNGEQNDFRHVLHPHEIVRVRLDWGGSQLLHSPRCFRKKASRRAYMSMELAGSRKPCPSG